MKKKKTKKNKDASQLGDNMNCACREMHIDIRLVSCFPPLTNSSVCGIHFKGNIGILGGSVYQLSNKDSFGPSCFNALLLSSRPFNHRFHANKPHFEEGERPSG